MMPSFNARLCATVLTALLVVGCGERSNAELMDAARRYVAKGDVKAAVIELRTLLQRRPQATEARFMLGKLAYEAGDLVAAEDQLRLAHQYGYPEEEVVPLLARVLAAMNRSSALTNEFGNLEFKDPAATADLKMQIAAAHMFENKFDDAKVDVARALELVPAHPDAAATMARLVAIAGDSAGAMRQVDELLARQPDNALAWALKGDLVREAAGGVSAEAIAAQRKALSLRGNLVQSHAAVITMLIDSGDRAGARAQWAELRQVLPDHPQTQFFDAVLAMMEGKPQYAQEIMHRMLLAAPNDMRLLLVGGQAELRLGHLEQAEAMLAKAVRLAFRAAFPRRLLAQVYLRSGRAAEALAALQPLIGLGVTDPIALTLAGQAHLTLGHTNEANEAFARALAASPNDARVRTAAAVAKLATGQAERALGELESIARSDTETTADMALISARFARRDFKSTLQAIDALAAKVPDDALPEQLRGQVAIAMSDKAAARRHLEAALAKQPNYFPALALLVELDVADGQAAAARQRLEAARKSEPGNGQVRLALAALMKKLDAPPSEVVAMLVEAIAASPTDPAAHVALIDQHLASGNFDLALSVAQKADVALPENFGLVDALGRVFMARGDSEQALATYNRMNVLWPRSSVPYVRLAEANLALRKTDAAAENLRMALKESPNSFEAMRLAATVALRQKRFAEARGIARTVQSRQPNDAAGYMLEGEIEMNLRGFDAAAAAYRKAFERAPGLDLAKRTHMALVASGQQAEAERWATRWRELHPDDVVFIVHLADLAVTRGQLAEAEARYREVMQRLPGNALAINNVAYMMVKQNKPGALPLAEQAAKLAPREPTIRDTLAAAYVQSGQFDKAIEAQRKALELAPAAAGLRFNLALILLQAGQREQAAAELDRLAQLGRSFNGYSEVAQLRKQIGP